MGKGGVMTHSVGETGHVDDHNDIEARITAAAARVGSDVSMPGGRVVGAPGHIDVHNQTTDALRTLMTFCDLDPAGLPDPAAFGDAGHVTDHDAWEAGLALVDALTPPSAPTLTGLVVIPAGFTVTWTAPASTGGGDITGYILEYQPSGSAPDAAWTAQNDDAADLTGPLMTGVVGSFDVRVKARNRWGVSEASNVMTGEVLTAFNDATGGTVTEYDKPDGSRWRVHTFTANGDFVVNTSALPFRVLAVGGGGNGTGWSSWGWESPGAGGGGGEVLDDELTVPTGTVAVTVGGANTATTLGSLLTARPGTSVAGTGGTCGDGVHTGGGGTGDYGGGGGGAGANGGMPNGGAGLSSDIRGTVEWFGGGGGGGGRSGATVGGGGGQGGGGAGVNDSSTPQAGRPNTGGGGGGGGKISDKPTPGSAGGSGIAAFAYQIA